MNEIVINRFNSEAIVKEYSKAINSYNILYPEKYPADIKNLNRFGIQRAILYWFASCVLNRQISSQDITVNNKTDCFEVAVELFQRSVLFGVTVLPGSSKPHKLVNNIEFSLSDIKIAFQNSLNQDSVFWNHVDKIIDDAISVKQYERIKISTIAIKFEENDFGVQKSNKEVVNEKDKYVGPHIVNQDISKQDNETVKERMPFWKLWFRCFIIIFLFVCVLGFLSGGETGLATAFGVSIVIAPIKSFLIACIIRFFQRVFN